MDDTNSVYNDSVKKTLVTILVFQSIATHDYQAKQAGISDYQLHSMVSKPP